MRAYHYIILFVPLFLLIFVIANKNTQSIIASNQSNIEYSDMLTNGCLAALKTCYKGNDDELLFDTHEKRRLALDKLVETICVNKGKSYNEYNMLWEESNLSFALLVDYNGFYICYNSPFDLSEKTIKANDGKLSITDINTFSETIGSYNVSYYLNNQIQVLGKEKLFIGPYEDFVKEYKDKKDINILADKKTFNEHKQAVIYNTIYNELNNLANTKSVNVKSIVDGYYIGLAGRKDTNARVFKNPGVIALLQGDTKYVETENINIFGYAGTEMMLSKQYDMKDEDGTKVYYEKGVLSKDEIECSGTMSELASKGAYPSPSIYGN